MRSGTLLVVMLSVAACESREQQAMRVLNDPFTGARTPVLPTSSRNAAPGEAVDDANATELVVTTDALYFSDAGGNTWRLLRLPRAGGPRTTVWTGDAWIK